jgi:uncharacterized membrane protein
MTTPRTRPCNDRAATRHRLGLGALLLLGLTIVVSGAHVAEAGAGLSVTTPFPTIETQPGSTVKLDLDITSDVVEPVELAVSGLPDGWQSTLRGGGFVIHSVTANPDKSTSVTLEVAVDPAATTGRQAIAVTGTAADGTTSVANIALDVVEQVNAGIGIVADFPSLSGQPATAFTYNLTVTNNTPEEQTFTFDPVAPQGWTATASPTAEAKAQTVTIQAGGTSDVRVSATPPDSTDAGTYPIEVTVTAANGATGKISLEAVVTGTPKLDMSTADQRLNVSGKAATEQRIPLIIANTGTAALESVKLAGTAPTGWDVSFDPQEVASVKPNETAQVTAIVKPASDAVAGDYAMTVRASAGSEASSLDLRYTLESSRTLGVIAIGVIVLAVGALVGVFVKFGRR